MNSEDYILTGQEEYADVYDLTEFYAAQELEEYEGSILKIGDGYKASVWLSEKETEILLSVAEKREIPPRHLIQEWVIENIKMAAQNE